MYNRILKVFALTVILGSYGGFLQAYDINNAINDTVSNNPDLASKREEIEVQRSNLYGSMTGFLPQVTAKSQNTDVDVRKNSGTSTVTKDSRVKSVAVSQNIFNGFKTVNQVRQAEHNLRAQEANYRIELNKKILSAIQAYQSVIINRKNLQVSQKNLEVNMRQGELVEKNFELGNEKITEVHAVRSRVAEAKSVLESAKGNLKIAEANFKQIVGVDPQNNLSEIEVASVMTPNSLEELTSIALQNNPAIKLREEQMDAAKKGVYIAAGTFSPTADFEFTHQNSRSVFEGGSKSRVRNNSYLLSLSIPLFQKGAEYTELKKAKHQEYSQEHTLQETKNSIYSQAASAWSKFQSSRISVKAQEEAVIAAQKAVDAAYEEAKIGTATSIFVIDRQNDLFIAERRLLNEKLEHVVSVYSIYELMGSIDNIKYKA